MTDLNKVFNDTGSLSISGVSAQRDLPNVTIAYKLHGTNFLSWSQFAGTFLKDREKFSLINLKEESIRLESLIETLENDLPSTTGTCALGFSGISFQPSAVLFSSALNASNKDFLHSWIIDSGASDHMTNSSKHFISYSPCPSNK